MSSKYENVVKTTTTDYRMPGRVNALGASSFKRKVVFICLTKSNMIIEKQFMPGQTTVDAI